MANQAAESEKALPIGAETQLFVDDAIVSAKRGVVRTLHPGKKLEQPVLVPDRAWEGKRVYIYGTVHCDAHAQQFRMWYLTRLGRGEQHRAPGLRERQGDMILYATSANGIHWEKPDLGLHEFDGSRDNNILIFDKHSPTVIVDEAADPSERYKMAGWDWSRAQFGYWVAHSADGLVWNDYDVNPIMMNSDETLEAITVAHDHHRGEYLAFHRRWGDVGGHMRRLIAVSTSRNFLDWSDPELIIVSDEQDDSWIQDPEQRGEFYGMSGFVYGRQYLGFLPVFNVVRDVRGQEVGAEQSPWDGQSRRSWRIAATGARGNASSIARPSSHAARRAASTPAASSVQPTGPSSTAMRSGTTTPPSTPCTAAQCHRRRPRSRAPHGGWTASSRWRGHFGGTVETVPLNLPAGQLVVNADASQGSLAIELLSADGETIPGFSLQDCTALPSDSVRHAVRWQNRERLPTGRPLRLRLHLDTAQLYSFHINEVEA